VISDMRSCHGIIEVGGILDRMCWVRLRGFWPSSLVMVTGTSWRRNRLIRSSLPDFINCTMCIAH